MVSLTNIWAEQVNEHIWTYMTMKNIIKHINNDRKQLTAKCSPIQMTISNMTIETVVRINCKNWCIRWRISAISQLIRKKCFWIIWIINQSIKQLTTNYNIIKYKMCMNYYSVLMNYLICALEWIICVHISTVNVKIKMLTI